MQEQFIKVLQQQIALLSQPEFDLEAWKKGVITRLLNIYPAADPKILQIQDLKIDYSSWALRDSNSSYKPIETCKKMGQAILEAIIDEIRIFGLRPLDKEEKDFTKIYQIVADEKKDKLQKLLKTPNDPAFKKYLQSLDKKKLADIIVSLVEDNS